MRCDLQKLLASAADLPAATPTCAPSVGERVLRDSVRMYEEMDCQRRRDRAAALGYYGADLASHTLDVLEMTQRAEKFNALADPWGEASALRTPNALERCVDQAQRVTELLRPWGEIHLGFAAGGLMAGTPETFAFPSSLLPRHEDLPLSERLSMLPPREHRRPPTPTVTINIHLHPKL